MPDALHPVPFHARPALAAPGVRARRPWSQPPHVDEPILDAARAPLSAYLSRNGPDWTRPRKFGFYVWMHLLRPIVTVSAWLAGLWYAWPYVLDAPTQPDTQRLLWLYAAIIATIFCVMLVVAPWRRRQQRQSQTFTQDDSSLMALADYIDVPPAQLSLYQATQRLFVQHNTQGVLRHAMTTYPAPRQMSSLLAEAS